VLTVTVPHTGAGSVAARVSGKDGQAEWEGSGAPAGAAPAVQFVVPLGSLGCSVCDLTVENRHGSIRTTFGIVAPGADTARQ
jgi:hypothetical protein